MATFATEALAQWSADAVVSQHVHARARVHLVDTAVAALAGYRSAGPSGARQMAGTVGGDGKVPLWFTGVTASVAGAAFANAAAACALDLDDGHRRAAGHPGAVVVPAVLAVADGHTDDEILSAIAVGYEVGVRISGSRDLNTVPTTNSGIWGGQAAAAAVGRLWGLPSEHIAQALAITATTNPSQAATPYTRFRANNVKEGIPWAAANGVVGAALARAGFTGPLDVLDHPASYDTKAMTGDLGKGEWAIESAYIKPYSCCRWLHAPLDCIVRLRAESTACRDIRSIHVETFARTLTLSNECRPTTIEGAQYSLPFCVAVAAVHGADALCPIAEGMLTDSEVLAVADRVTVAASDELSAAFPAATPGRITVTTHDGVVFRREASSARGDREDPFTTSDLLDKVRAVTAQVPARAAGRGLFDAARAVLEGDLAPLMGRLGRSPE